jgi:predicted acyl esterase
VLIDKDVAMKTRDGVTLRADVYRPAAPGRYPVLLSRLPYDKNLRRRPGDIDVFVEHGTTEPIRRRCRCRTTWR